MSLRLAYNKDYELMQCGECGIDFYVPYWFYKERYDRGTGWACPNGHNRIFKESDITRLKKELDATNRRLEIAKADAQRETQLRQRLEKRVKAGICIKCKRYFKQVKAHMDTCHGK